MLLRAMTVTRLNFLLSCCFFPNRATVCSSLREYDVTLLEQYAISSIDLKATSWFSNSLARVTERSFISLLTNWELKQVDPNETVGIYNSISKEMSQDELQLACAQGQSANLLFTMKTGFRNASYGTVTRV